MSIEVDNLEKCDQHSAIIVLWDIWASGDMDNECPLCVALEEVDELKEKVTKLEGEVADLEDEVVRLQSEV